MSTLAVAALACHGTDAGAVRGALALAEELGARHGAGAETIGTPSGPAPASDFRADLAGGADCFRAAAEHVERSLAEGSLPVLCAGDCSLCLATLAAALRARPGARVLWLDAHGDFNSPETTSSGFLGGMCLAGACGVWDAGLGEPVAPERVVLAGVRDLDSGERDLLDGSAATRVEPGPGLVERTLAALGDAPVYVHLDVDVLDADFFQPSRYPAPGGVAPGELAELLEAVGRGREVVGIEITALGAPDAPDGRDEVRAAVTRAVEGLLDAPSRDPSG